MAFSAASLVVVVAARNSSIFSTAWANLVLRDSRSVEALEATTYAVVARSSMDFTVALSMALDDTSFATAQAAARRATTSYISNWVLSARSSPMVCALLAPHLESVCFEQGISNYKACKNRKDKDKLPVQGDLSLFLEGWGHRTHDAPTRDPTQGGGSLRPPRPRHPAHPPCKQPRTWSARGQ